MKTNPIITHHIIPIIQCTFSILLWIIPPKITLLIDNSSLSCPHLSPHLSAPFPHMPNPLFIQVPLHSADRRNILLRERQINHATNYIIIDEVRICSITVKQPCISKIFMTGCLILRPSIYTRPPAQQTVPVVRHPLHDLGRLFSAIVFLKCRFFQSSISAISSSDFCPHINLVRDSKFY